MLTAYKTLQDKIFNAHIVMKYFLNMPKFSNSIWFIPSYVHRILENAVCTCKRIVRLEN